MSNCTAKLSYTIETTFRTPKFCAWEFFKEQKQHLHRTDSWVTPFPLAYVHKEQFWIHLNVVLYNILYNILRHSTVVSVYGWVYLWKYTVEIFLLVVYIFSTFGGKIVIALKKKGVIHKEVNFLRDGIKKSYKQTVVRRKICKPVVF